MSIFHLEHRALMKEAKDLSSQIETCANRLDGIIVTADTYASLISVMDKQFAPLSEFYLRLSTLYQQTVKQLEIWLEAQNDVPQSDVARIAYLRNCKVSDLQLKQANFEQERTQCEKSLASLRGRWKKLESSYKAALERGNAEFKKHWTGKSYLGPLSSIMYQASFLLPRAFWKDERFKNHSYFFQNAEIQGEVPSGHCVNIREIEELPALMDSPAGAANEEEYRNRYAIWKNLDTLPFTFDAPPQIVIEGLDPQSSYDNLKLAFDFQKTFREKSIHYHSRLDAEVTVYPGELEDIPKAIIGLVGQINALDQKVGQHVLSIFFDPIDSILEGVRVAFMCTKVAQPPQFSEKTYSIIEGKEGERWCSARAQLTFTNYNPLLVEVVWNPYENSTTIHVRGEEAEPQAQPIVLDDENQEAPIEVSILDKDRALLERWPPLKTEIEKLQSDLDAFIPKLKERLTAAQTTAHVVSSAILEQINTFARTTYAPLRKRLYLLEEQKIELRAALKKRITFDEGSLSAGVVHYFALQYLDRSKIQSIRPSIDHEKDKLRALDRAFRETTKVFKEKKDELDADWKKIENFFDQIKISAKLWMQKATNDKTLWLGTPKTNRLDLFFVFDELREAIRGIDRNNLNLGLIQPLKERLSQAPQVSSECKALKAWLDMLEKHVNLRNSSPLDDTLEHQDFFDSSLYSITINLLSSEDEKTETIEWIKKNYRTDRVLLEYLLSALVKHFFAKTGMLEDIASCERYETQSLPEILRFKNASSRERDWTRIEPLIEEYFNDLVFPGLPELYALSKRHNIFSHVVDPTGKKIAHLNAKEEVPECTFLLFCRSEAPLTPLFRHHSNY